MTELQFFNYFVQKGLTKAGAAGLMGNLYHESGLRSNNLENSKEKPLGMTDAQYTAAVNSGAYKNFAKDAAGYGLAQWTYWSRKQNLLDFAKARNASIDDEAMQMDFLMMELAGYTDVLNTLKTTSSVRAASDIVMLKFERPADQTQAALDRRYQTANGIYERCTQEKNAMIKTAEQLAALMEQIATQYKTLYVSGGWGQPATAANKQRAVNQYAYNRQRSAMINAASADTFFFDCVCVIKACLWGWTGDKTKANGGATYASNGVPDIGEGTMINLCKHVSTNWKNIQRGEVVYMPGHIGVYVGDGLAVECTPAWKNCVQITAVGNIGAKQGFNTRTWTKHGKLPYLAYEDIPFTEVDPLDGLTDEQLANMVMAGRFGTGEARKKALGARWRAVQDIVNAMSKKTNETVYIVRAGDTLSAIAKAHGTTYQKIAHDNGIADVNKIYPGQKLVIK